MANDFENGVWRTVGGRRIFIRDGEDLSSAMKRSKKFKSTRAEDIANMDPEEFKKQAELEKRIAVEKEKFREQTKTEQRDIKVNGPDTDTIIDDFEERVVSKYDNTMSQDEKKREIDNYVQKYKAQGEPMRNVSAEDMKEVLYDNYRIKGGSDNSDGAGKAIVFDRNDETFKYKGSYPDSSMRFANESSKQIENLGTHVLSEYEKGNMSYEEAKKALNTGVSGVKGVSAGEGFYHIGNNVNMKDTLYNTAAQKKLINQMNYYTNKLEENKSNSGVPSRKNETPGQTISNILKENQAYKNAYQEYKKKHPNTKLSFGQFVNMSEGK